MDKRLLFNEDVTSYEKYRPMYCEELFNDIVSYSKLNSNCSAIEIGIGTGQATRPFLETGCSLTAIEIGRNLTEYSREKFSSYENFNIVHCAFEDFSCPDDSIDLIYSATAFHWIPDEIGYQKVYTLLKENGTIALFWNKPFVGRENDILHQKIQSIYDKYLPSNTKPIENNPERYKKISGTIKKYGFRDIDVKLYHSVRKFKADEYVSLLKTYSDHRSLETSVKKAFESEIKRTIESFGNQLNVYDTMDLYLARK